MGDFSVLAPFVIAVLIGAMVPGPATTLVLHRSALHGTRATIPVIVGMDVGLYCWVVVTALGLGALGTASEIGYVALRIAGAIVDVNVLAITVLLGLVHVAVDATWYLLVAGLVGRMRALFARSAVRRWLEWATGTVLIALGLRLAMSSR